ncbi:MAG: extracellular solute-binding protein family 1 [Frankiales bacterium]|nr:extracellular solute-binding protein family 1 [Frankiales bacterium]
MSHPPRTLLRLLSLLVSLLCVTALAACSSNKSAGPDTTATAAKVTLHVGLFGTFGYKEAGLYDDYMKQHPNVTIVEDAVEQENSYYQALQTHLAAGSGLDDVQGIEIGRIADVTSNHASQFVNLNDLGANSVKSTFYSWKWQAATTKDGKTLGLGTDTGPLQICYRTDLFAAAGLPTDRDAVSRLWPSWADFLATGERYKAASKGKTAFTDSAGGIFNAIMGQSQTQFYDASGQTVYDSNPAITAAWQLASAAATQGLTAGLQQFDPSWNTGIASGSFATLACPAWMIGYIKGQAGQKSKDHWNIASIPGGGGNQGGSYLAITKASKHQQAAYDLIRWLTAPAQQLAMWTKAQHFPSSSVAAADPAVAAATDAYFNNAPIGKLFNQSANDLPVQILGPEDGPIRNQFGSALLTIEVQHKSPAAAWAAALAGIKNAIGN